MHDMRITQVRAVHVARGVLLAAAAGLMLTLAAGLLAGCGTAAQQSGGSSAPQAQVQKSLPDKVVEAYGKVLAQYADPQADGPFPVAPGDYRFTLYAKPGQVPLLVVGQSSKRGVDNMAIFNYDEKSDRLTWYGMNHQEAHDTAPMIALEGYKLCIMPLDAGLVGAGRTNGGGSGAKPNCRVFVEDGVPGVGPLEAPSKLPPSDEGCITTPWWLPVADAKDMETMVRMQMGAGEVLGVPAATDEARGALESRDPQAGPVMEGIYLAVTRDEAEAIEGLGDQMPAELFPPTREVYPLLLFPFPVVFDYPLPPYTSGMAKLARSFAGLKQPLEGVANGAWVVVDLPKVNHGLYLHRHLYDYPSTQPWIFDYNVIATR